MFIKLDRSMADVSRKQRVGTFQTSDKRPGGPRKISSGRPRRAAHSAKNAKTGMDIAQRGRKCGQSPRRGHAVNSSVMREGTPAPQTGRGDVTWRSAGEKPI
jgi:hypothetical protein